VLRWLRLALTLLVAALLIELPVSAVSNSALGFVVQSRGALLDGAGATNGTSLYSGDVLATGADGSLNLQLSGSQLFLFPSSSLSLTDNAAGVTVALSAGVASFSTMQGSDISIRALGVLVRPKNPAATRAQVQLKGPDELLVTSYQGPLELDFNGQPYNLAEGHTYKVEIASDNPQADASHHIARSKKRLVIAIFGGAVAAYAGMYIYHELHESPSVP
jgi:hypothetical protein